MEIHGLDVEMPGFSFASVWVLLSASGIRGSFGSVSDRVEKRNFADAFGFGSTNGGWHAAQLS
jgi:hypothetical protein